MKDGVIMGINNISIRNIIIIVFIVLMLITVGVISYIVFSNWMFSAGVTTTKIAEDMNAEIFKQIDTFIDIPEHINEINQKLIENGIINITNETERDKFFVGVLKSHNSDIYSFSYGTENGEYYGARRNEYGVIEIIRNNADTDGCSWYYSVNDDLTSKEIVVKTGKFDPRTRDWYNAAKKMGKPIFSPIYKHFVMNDLTVSAAWPIYKKDGEIQGVLGTHIILSYIDNFLKEIVQDKNGYAVIIEKDTGNLIANSFDMDNFTTLEDGTIKRYKLSEAEYQTIVRAYEQYKATQDDHFLLKNERDSQYLNFTGYHKEGLNWLVITAIPENLLLAGIVDNMKLTLLIVIISVILSIVIYLFVTSKLIKPIDNLIEITEKLSSGDLSQRVTIVRNDEIGRVSNSFNKMADTIYMLVNNLEIKVKDRTAELEATNCALNESKDQLRLILDSTAEAIYGIDKEGYCTFCNSRCIEMLGYKHEDELLGKNMHWLIHHSCNDGNNLPINDCKIYKAIRENKGTHVKDEVFWRADNTNFDVEYYSYPQYKDNKVIGAVITFMDITERKRDEEQIKYLSSHDSLTGLFNRRCFEDALINYDTKENLPISIIFADVNGLKLINDIFGHTAGDTLIKKSAEILKKVCRNGDFVARVGGDEFIILLPNTEASDAEKIIIRVKSELTKEKIDAIKCSIALGCDTKTNEKEYIERTIESAENKMYKEKTLNRKTFSSDIINTIIVTLHDRNPRGKIHSINVSELCQNIALAMKLPETEVKKLKGAGFLHDIGKIVLDEYMINKEGELTEEEKLEMQQHPVVGYRILNLFDDTLDLAEGVYYHHECWDGSGYPKGLKGEEIPVLARIISIAETYERKLHESDKLEMIKKQEAIRAIRDNAGKCFDPEIAELFIGIMESEGSIEQ